MHRYVSMHRYASMHRYVSIYELTNKQFIISSYFYQTYVYDKKIDHIAAYNLYVYL